MTEPVDEPMNVTEPIRCALAIHDSGYSWEVDSEDVAKLLAAYDRLTVPRCDAGSATLRQALEHLGNAVYFAADIHPDDRNEALNNALAFYNKQMPRCKVEPSGHGFQRIIDPPLVPPPSEAGREMVIEQCAQVCDAHAKWAEDKIEDDPASTRSQIFAGISNTANDCAEMVRALSRQDQGTVAVSSANRGGPDAP